MTDHFTEHLVKKVPTSQERTKTILLVLAAVVLVAGTAFVAVATGLLVILMITVVVIYGAYYILSGQGIEYEYTFTNGELDVDKIMGKRRRTNLITVDASKFEAFGELTDDVADKPDATLVLCSDNTGEGEYYADLTTEEYGETRLVFTPSEKMVAYIEEALPRTLKYHRRHGI
ncbi:MAG: hypothetical protein IJ512_00855 [Ruminococcus sp.]|nr:hypothetical protein [Ruminococcus sp.]